MDELTKEDLLDKLRMYVDTPDDDTIRVKNKIKEMFIECPYLLYALNNKELELELFMTVADDEGNEYEIINFEGEWDRYFGETAPIRPYLFIPETQTEVKHYVCYQISFKELPRYNNSEKYCLITFNILIHGNDAIDKLTGIPRHDLIASIIREKMAWSGIAMSNAVPVQDIEGTTDNNYITRTLTYSVQIPNNLVVTEKVGDKFYTHYANKGKP